jgi:hypothetical protein
LGGEAERKEIASFGAKQNRIASGGIISAASAALMAVYGAHVSTGAPESICVALICAAFARPVVFPFPFQ